MKVTATRPEEYQSGATCNTAENGTSDAVTDNRADRSGTSHASVTCTQCRAGIPDGEPIIFPGYSAGRQFSGKPVCRTCARAEKYGELWPWPWPDVRRYPLSAYDHHCDRCGRWFYGAVHRRYCSEECGELTRRDRRRYLRRSRPFPEPVGCVTCDRLFTPRRADARYCSPACRQSAYRRRTRTEAAA